MIRRRRANLRARPPALAFMYNDFRQFWAQMEIGKLISKSIPEVASEQSTVAPDCYENFVV